jgi:3-phenylpropionate/trans-cinnamate dioxygenase ferredoxin reductase component
MRPAGIVTVVGNGVAGYACARLLAESGVPVTLIGPGLPCDRPPLSKRALVRRTAPYMATADGLVHAGIRHLDGAAVDVDLVRRRLTFRSSAGVDLAELAFDDLVWATGLRATRPPIPGLEGAHQNADPAGLEALLPHLERPGRRVAVVGAGLIGTETAATLASSHRVTLVERADVPLGRLHRAVGTEARRVLAALGVDFAGGCGLERIVPGPRGTHVLETSTHGSIGADVVIAAAGVASTLPSALGSGPTVDTDDRLAVEGLDGVWACGDTAAFPHPRFGRVAIPHWDNARAGGAHVARAILGSREPFARDPYWFSDIGPMRVQQVGFEPAVCAWSVRDGLHIGHADDGRAACVLILNSPHRLNDARRLVAA